MKHKYIIVIFVSILVFVCSSFHAAHSATIININYKYKIAFTDLTANDVKPGELVNVTMSDGKLVNLKVLETYPLMAKLTNPDGEAALTDAQFSAITSGNLVVPAGMPVMLGNTAARSEKSGRAMSEAVTPSAGGADERSSHIESYAPAAGVPASQLRAAEDRTALLEQRLDQMMTNNIKLTETITQLLSGKASAETATAAVRSKADELTSANAALTAKVKELEASVALLEKDKAISQKEIENLNLKLGELKKKLAKMVEIVNTNMKAYEKQ